MENITHNGIPTEVSKICRELAAFARAKGLTHKMIADATGIKRGNVTRFFLGNTNPTLATIIAISRAIGLAFVSLPIEKWEPKNKAGVNENQDTPKPKRKPKKAKT